MDSTVGHSGMLLLMVMVMLVLLFSVLVRSNKSITTSTVNRSPLNEQACIEYSVYINDQADWISSQSKATKGLKEFYKLTGVQPYLIIANTINGKGGNISDSEVEEYLNSVYNSTFEDKGHLIFLFLEYAEGEYKDYIYAGNQAASVIDQEAQEIIYDYADYYYTSDLSDDEYFSTVFSKAANRIMVKTITRKDIGLRVITLVGITLICVVIGFVIIRRKRLRIQELEEHRKILDTPITGVVDDPLKEKYKED